jgi:hypothetical protein
MGVLIGEILGATIILFAVSLSLISVSHELRRIADALEDFSDQCDEEPARKAS